MARTEHGASEQLAREAAQRFWRGVDGEYQTRRRRGRAIVAQVVRDNAGRTTGALASIDGSADQPILIDHGQPMATGDVYVVINDGTQSMPQWRAIRKVHSASAVPSGGGGELPVLPTPTGLRLFTGASIGGPGQPIGAWIFATWEIAESQLYGNQIYSEVQYADNEEINRPSSIIVWWTAPTTFVAADIGTADTMIPRDPVEGYTTLDDFPFIGRMRIEGELIDYSTHVAGEGDSGIGAIGGTGILTDSVKNWDADTWRNYILIDSTNTKFKIIGNDASSIYVSGDVASGSYQVHPGFTGCERGAMGSTIASHPAGAAISCESIGAMITGLSPGKDYNVRVRIGRFDGALSPYTAWQTITTELDDEAPPTPTDFAAESTTTGIHLTWSGPTLITVPDLAGFYIFQADDDQGTGETYLGMIGPRTETLVFTPHFNLEQYYAIESVDTSGNRSDKTAWLPGKKQPAVGVNLLPNADFEVASDGQFPDYWHRQTFGSNTEVLYGNYGLLDGKGVRINLPTYPGSAVYGYIDVPYPLASWKIQAEAYQSYTCSVYFKTSFPEGSLVYEAEDLVEGKCLFTAYVASHNGSNTSTNASFLRTPRVISETGDGWKRMEFTVQPDPFLWMIFDGYYFVHLQIHLQNKSGTAITMDLDRPQLEMAAEASAWTLGTYRPPGTGLRIDPSGIIGTYLHITGDGDIASDVVPAYDYGYSLGSPGRRWNTVYCETLIADNIEDLTGTSHNPVTLYSSTEEDVFGIGEDQVLSLDAQTAGLVFASPASGGALAPTFKTLETGHASTGAPLTTLSNTTSNSEGTATSFARSDHIHGILTSSAPGANDYILTTTSAGNINLGGGLFETDVAGGKIKTDGVLEFQSDGTIETTSSGSLDLAPEGDLIASMGGKDFLPDAPYRHNIGSPQRKWLSLHVAELWVETLVAQDVISTIGGRILVTHTTWLTRDLDPDSTTMYVSHNQAVDEDVVYLEGRGKVEFIKVDSAASSAPEELTNGGFESGLTGWTQNDGDGNAGTSSSVKRSGAASASLLAGSSRNTYIYQSEGVSANERYVLSFWYADNGTGVRWGIWNATASEWIIPLKQTESLGTDFDYIESRFTVPSGCSSIRVYFYCPDQSGDTAYVDDASLKKAEYSYTVVRDLDGTGANWWWAGDAVANLGQTGDGWIDIFSTQGINSVGTGPTIMGNVRQSATWSDWEPRWAIGNMNGIYGVTDNYYGFGLGDYDSGNFLRYDENGGFLFQAGAGHIVMDNDGMEFDLYQVESEVWSSPYGIHWVGTTNAEARIWGWEKTSTADVTLFLDSICNTGDTSAVYIRVWESGSTVETYAYFGTDGATINTTGYLGGGPNIINLISDDVCVDGGLYVGAASQSCTDGVVECTHGMVIYNPGSPYYGYSIDMASATGDWTRSFNFLDGSTVLFGYGAFGTSTPAITYGWIGEAYNDNGVVRIYPGSVLTLGNVAPDSTYVVTDETGAALQIYQRGVDTPKKAVILENSDVSHGMADRGPNSAFLTFGKLQDTTGGAWIQGFNELNQAIYIEGNSTSDNTTKGTTGTAPIMLVAENKSGSDVAACGTDANLVAIRNYTTTRFLFDAEGSAHADVEWTTFDQEDDVAMLADLQTALGQHRGMVKDQFVDFLKYNQVALEAAGIVHFDPEAPGHAMVNFTRLSMLLTGAILQLAGRQDELEKLLQAPA